MAQFKSIKDDPFYKPRKESIDQTPKPEMHFYPNMTDEEMLSGKYDIDFTFSYCDIMQKMKQLVDIHTPQMQFANPKTEETYNLFIHQISEDRKSQTIGVMKFGQNGDMYIAEWV